MSFKYYIDYILWRTQVPPWRYVSQALWILLSGWIFFLSYILAAVPLTLSIVGIIFVPKVVQIAIFSFDPIGFAVVKTTNPSRWYHDPHNPIVIILNIAWFILLGWEFFLLHIVFAIVQALTIVGIGNAITHLKIAVQTITPYGKHIEIRPHPLRPVKPMQNGQQGQQGQQQLQMEQML